MEEAALATSVQLHELEIKFYCVGLITHFTGYLLQQLAHHSQSTRCCRTVFSMCISFLSILLYSQPSVSTASASSDSTRIESNQLGLVESVDVEPTDTEDQLWDLSIHRYGILGWSWNQFPVDTEARL